MSDSKVMEEITKSVDEMLTHLFDGDYVAGSCKRAALLQRIESAIAEARPKWLPIEITVQLAHRQWLAGMALQGILANSSEQMVRINAAQTASMALECADALLSAQEGK